MKKIPTLFLRMTVVLMGLAALAFCFIAVPSVWPAEGGYGPILIGMCISTIPFLFALYQTMKLLNLIDNNAAFSEASVRILRNIRNCGIVIGSMYAAGMPYIFRVADADDAPGGVAIGLIIVFASFVIAVFAMVLQKLLQSAIDIKKETDLLV